MAKKRGFAVYIMLVVTVVDCSDDTPTQPSQDEDSESAADGGRATDDGRLSKHCEDGSSGSVGKSDADTASIGGVSGVVDGENNGGTLLPEKPEESVEGDVCIRGVDNYCMCLLEVGLETCSPFYISTLQSACYSNETNRDGQSFRDIMQCHIDSVDASGNVVCIDAVVCMETLPAACDACLDAYCSEEINACDRDVDCVAVVQCIADCSEIAEECITQCMRDNIVGLPTFQEFAFCQFEKCPMCS